MKKRAIAAVLLCWLLVFLFALCGCQSDVEANRGRKINSVNHRGYGDAPENTLVAYRMSKEMGFTMVETDVSFTKDGQAVLLHDDTVNRTSDIKGIKKVKIGDLTLEEVRQLDFGSWKDEKFAGEKIPTFQEFVDLCIELELYPYIEIKNGATSDQVAYLASIIDEANIDVTWIARNIDYLEQLSTLRPNDRLGLIVNVIGSGKVKALAKIDNGRGLCFIDAYHGVVVPAQINTCKKYNMPLEVWTIDKESTISNLDPYITGVTSNYCNAQSIFEQL